jgi:hypothetical protein
MEDIMSQNTQEDNTQTTDIHIPDVEDEFFDRLQATALGERLFVKVFGLHCDKSKQEQHAAYCLKAAEDFHKVVEVHVWRRQ